MILFPEYLKVLESHGTFVDSKVGLIILAWFAWWQNFFANFAFPTRLQIFHLQPPTYYTTPRTLLKISSSLQTLRCLTSVDLDLRRSSVTNLTGCRTDF